MRWRAGVAERTAVAGEGSRGRRGRRRKPDRRALVARELASVLALALVVSWLLKTFLVQAFFIPSESMEATLLRGDRVLVNRLVPSPLELRRGDVVVFRDPGGWLDPALDLEEGASVAGALRSGLEFVGLAPAATGEDLIKRVVGVPGDRVVCCDASGRVSVGGVPREEPYLFPGDPPSDQRFDVRVPQGGLWVMGDRRGASRDSRAHLGDARGGMVPLENVIGRAFAVIWPLERAARLTAPDTLALPGALPPP